MGIEWANEGCGVFVVGNEVAEALLLFFTGFPVGGARVSSDNIPMHVMLE